MCIYKCIKQIGSCLEQQTATGIRMCITPARTLEAKVWLAAVGAKGKAGACGKVPAAAGLAGCSQGHPDFSQLASGPLCYTPPAGTSVQPAVLLGTAPYIPFRIWQLHQRLLPQCLELLDCLADSAGLSWH